MARGDIVFVDLPQPAGHPGHEQIGQRPALIVHEDTTSSMLPVVMVVPFTTNPSAQRFPHTILVNPSAQNGLSNPSILMVFQLRALDRTRIRNTIGNLETDLMTIVDIELRRLLGI